jgi:hypothetical protein
MCRGDLPVCARRRLDDGVRTDGSIIHPDDREEVDRAVRAATSADRPFALEYRTRTCGRADRLGARAKASR